MNEWLDDIKTAVAFLTRLPMPHPDGAMPANFVRAHRAFPIVGALIGGVTILPNGEWKISLRFHCDLRQWLRKATAARFPAEKYTGPATTEATEHPARYGPSDPTQTG